MTLNCDERPDSVAYTVQVIVQCFTRSATPDEYNEDFIQPILFISFVIDYNKVSESYNGEMPCLKYCSFSTQS